MSIYERLWQFVSDLEKGNRTAFAEKIGVNRVTFLSYLTEKGEGRLRVQQLAEIAKQYPTANIHWLVTGQGEPYAQPEQSEGSSKEEIVEISTPVTDAVRDIELSIQRAGGSKKQTWLTIKSIADEHGQGG
ncbi:MAG: hypothetical protein ACNI27_12995 [Desulfovibrio sp.]